MLAQLGWLITAQSWSGFDADGEELPVEAEALPVRKSKQPNDAARKVVAAAEAAEAEAAHAVQARRDDVAAAQEGLDDLRAQLHRAEQVLGAAAVGR